MKAKFVKALSLLLVIITIFSCIPVIGFAEDEIEEEYEYTPIDFDLGLYKTKIGFNKEFCFLRIDDGWTTNYNTILSFYKLNPDGSKEEFKDSTKYQHYGNIYVPEEFVPSEDDTYGVKIEQFYYADENDNNSAIIEQFYHETESDGCIKSEIIELTFKLSELYEQVHVIEYDYQAGKYFIEEMYLYDDEGIGYSHKNYFFYQGMRASFDFAISVPYNDSLDNYKFYCESDKKFVKYIKKNGYNGRISFRVNDDSRIIVVNKKTKEEIYRCVIWPTFGYDTFEEEMYYDLSEILEPIYKELIWPAEVWKELTIDSIISFIMKTIDFLSALLNFNRNFESIFLS